MNFVFLVGLMSTTYNISIVGLKLIGDDPDKLKYSAVIGIMLLQLFICEWAPDVLFGQSKLLADHAYFVPFSSGFKDRKNGSLLRITIMRCQKPIQLRAGGHIKLSMESFGSVFRHGDRTPEAYPKGFYPTDPYRNHTFEPVGCGGLTNAGKNREYQIGTYLRNLYNEFLGSMYLSSDISVISTDLERTKMSLLLVLAGLYPPQSKQIWKNNLNWQPIPIDSIPVEVSSFTNPPTCPTYRKEMQRVMESKEYKEDVSRFHGLMRDLTTFMGRQVNTTKIIYNLYHTLTAEKSMNLTLPKWTESYFPSGQIINATIFEYKTKSYNKLLTKLNGGLFLRKVLNDAIFNRNADQKKNPKVHLYSVHETSVAAVLQALNVWNNIIPQYSSAIIFEVYKNKSTHFIKLAYYKGIPSEHINLIIPGCSEYCEINKFISILGHILPHDILEACFGAPNNSELMPKFTNPIEWIYAKLRHWFSL